MGYSGFTRLHEDVRSLRVALKKWCRDESNYQNLFRNKHNPAFESVIDEWLSEHPDIASKIAAAGSRAQHIKNKNGTIFATGMHSAVTRLRVQILVWGTRILALPWLTFTKPLCKCTTVRSTR